MFNKYNSFTINGVISNIPLVGNSFVLNELKFVMFDMPPNPLLEAKKCSLFPFLIA